MKRLIVWIFFLTSLASHSFGNPKEIEIVNSYLSLSPDLSVVFYKSGILIYNNKFFVLTDVEVKKNEFGFNEISGNPETILVERNIDSKISVSHQYSPNGLSFGLTFQYATSGFQGEILCLLTKESFYSYDTNRNNHTSYPGVFRKYTVIDKSCVEAKQPFYSLDEFTESNTVLDLFDTIDGSRIASIAPNTKVRVLGVAFGIVGGESWYLVSGKTGVVGWYKSKCLGKIIHASSVESIVEYFGPEIIHDSIITNEERFRGRGLQYLYGLDFLCYNAAIFAG